MNQKWLVILLALLLCGCRNQQTPSETDGVSVPAIAVTEPTVPVGFYAPDSPAEKETGGVIKAFPLGAEDAVGIRFLGEDILLFSGHDLTTLTLLSGDSKYVKAQLQLSCSVQPEDPAVVVDDYGVAYIDHQNRTLFRLNGQLEEVSRIALPEGCGTPALTADRRLLYYCTEDALRVMNLETGLDRLLREMAFPVQELTALHCNDTVLQCRVIYSDGQPHTLFLSADTGVLLHESTEDIPLWTSGDFYTAFHMDGIYPEWLTGTGSCEPQVLIPETEPSLFLPVPELQSMLTYRAEADGFAQLECYHLESGYRTAQLTVSGLSEPASIQWHPEQNILWFLATDAATGQSTLYAWDLNRATTETGTYLQPRCTSEQPDPEGLAQCSAIARRISIKHGVHILLWTEATAFQPWDYTLEAEYQVPLLRRRLEELDAVLSDYPEGFLERAASGTGIGRLSICLVRSINGRPDTGALESAMGLQFWDDKARSYLAITLGPDMAQHLYHELFHIIDSRVLSTSDAYDTWSKLNPKGFSYDPRFTTSRSGEGRSYLDPENRYFIDLYAMCYPKEDRARIMEYAMLDVQEDLFRSAPMQEKLRKLCLGIREAFGLEQEPDIYRWEQYLDTPVAPSQ